MRSVLLLALILLCSGCQRGALTKELTSWRGQTEDALIARLGQPTSNRFFTNGVPNVGVAEFVESRIREHHPDYRGPVKHLRWFRDPDYYDVFFVENNNCWIVVDGLKWHKDAIF